MNVDDPEPSPNAIEFQRWPSSEYSSNTEAIAPPSCATRDLRDSRPEERDVLTPDQHYSFHSNGFLVIPQLFSTEEVDLFNNQLDYIISSRASNEGLREVVADWFLSTPEETRGYMRNAPNDAFKKPFKINDLYLDDAKIRRYILDKRITAVVGELLDSIPVVMNTLNLYYGSEQRFHFDTLYMPPPSTNKMIAAWIALDEVNEKNGPLCYYPRSHMIKPYRFSTGKLNERIDEINSFDLYINEEIQKRGLKEERFCAQKGDVFIWHPQLYHGGMRITDNYEHTRKSMVTHYFSALDFPHDGKSVRRSKDGLYYVRPRLKVSS